jgi:hypothetical protein
MNEHNATPSLLSLATDEQLLPSLLAQYLVQCRASIEDHGKRREGGFPNLAGFCRFLGCGTAEFDALRTSHPVLTDRLLAILEDEALNLLHSPTLLNAYLRHRLTYGERPGIAKETTEDGLRLIFEHDILEDGE